MRRTNIHLSWKVRGEGPDGMGEKQGGLQGDLCLGGKPISLQTFKTMHASTGKLTLELSSHLAHSASQGSPWEATPGGQVQYDGIVDTTG